MYKILFELGDWSHDGHNQSESYRVLSNKDVYATREAHFTFAEKYFDIGKLCSEYGEYNITDEKQITVLKSLNLWQESYSEYLESEQLFELWVKLLQVIDPELEYTVQDENEFTSVQFGGFDQKQRHLSVPGYGLFE